VQVRWFRRQRKRGDDSHTSLYTALTQRWKKSDLVYRMQSNAVGNITQESFCRLDHALTLAG
jgi:hypothetical protein